MSDLSQLSDQQLLALYKSARSIQPKAAPAATGKLSPQDAKALQALRDAANQSLNTATQAERFLDINRTHGTGGAYGLPVVGGMLRAAKGAVDPDFAQMESITSAVAPGLRPPGSGSSSDKDVQFYTHGFTNTEVPYEANVKTYDRLHEQSDKASAHAAFMDKWAQARGSLMGGEEAFSKYWAQKQGSGLKARSAGAKVGIPDGATIDVFGRPVT